MALNVEVAIKLVKQAIDQDKKRNYEEAARCYREAIVIFKTIKGQVSKGVQNAIDLKCSQYEGRLKKLDKYLLSNADLSQLFKDVVEQNSAKKRPDSQNSDDSGSSGFSENWKNLKNCPMYREGIDYVEKAKKKDKKGYFQEALGFYEDGSMLLLEAAEANPEDPNNEHLRFKCLLIHERIEMIRNHLDAGLPLKPVKDSLASTIEYSLKETSTGGLINQDLIENQDNEEETLQSSELGSRQSLDKLSMKKSQSLASLPCDSAPGSRNYTPDSIPLADLDDELKISDLSLISHKSYQSIKSYSGSIKASLHNDSSFYPENDRNVTELTLANSGLDLDEYLKGKTSPDSGISDQSPKAEQPPRSRHQSSAYASSNEDEIMLQVHRVEDGTLVIGTPGPRSSPPAVKISPSASLKRQAKLKAEADELTVLSQEDVVDTAILAQTRMELKNEKIPSRAMAGQPGYEDSDEELNKGCFYMIACLDAFWIL